MNKPQRKRLRLPCYDYSQNGCYFVTICTKNRQLLLGEIINGEMQLNEIRKIVERALISVLNQYKQSEIPSYIIMPNHLHFVWFNQNDVSLSFIVKLIKGRASFAYRKYISKQNFTSIPLWQRSFYDHIIRNDKSYEQIVEYIETNPLMWEIDKLNPNFNSNNDRAG